MKDLLLSMHVFFKEPWELVVDYHGQIGQKGNYSEVSLLLIKQLTLICAHFCKALLQRLGQESARFIHQLYGRWQGLLMLNVVESKALLPLVSHWERWRQKQRRQSRISKADGHGWRVNITPYVLEICCCATAFQPQCRQGCCPPQKKPCLLDFIGSTKWRRQIIHDRWELSLRLTPWIWADVFWLPWKQWNPLMTAYLTFTHSDSSPLIATLHLPGVFQPGRLITNLSGGFTRDMNPALAEKWCVQWRNMETDTGLVTDDLLHRALNGSRHNGWLGLIRAVSSEQLFHFTSLQGATIKRDHRGFLGEPVSSRWSRMGEDNRDEEINCCLR